MIDMPTVGGYGSYHAFNNDTKRNDDTEETSFSKVFGEQKTEERMDSAKDSVAGVLEEVLTGSSNMDFEIYTFTGKTRSLGMFTGRNINIEV